MRSGHWALSLNSFSGIISSSSSHTSFLSINLHWWVFFSALGILDKDFNGWTIFYLPLLCVICLVLLICKGT